MKPRALDLLACPACAGNLQLEAARSDAGEVMEGSLFCATCAKSYPILRGGCHGATTLRTTASVKLVPLPRSRACERT